jgi:predicted nucleic acid-binding protein
MKYLWDTNSAIYYLQQQFPASAEEFMDVIIAESTPCISAITEIELLCWKVTTERDAEVLKNFIDSILIIELEQPIKLKTADIRKEHKMKLPDAIIAATATGYNLTLITRNIKDFKNIPAINLVNPWDK